MSDNLQKIATPQRRSDMFQVALSATWTLTQNVLYGDSSKICSNLFVTHCLLYDNRPTHVMFSCLPAVAMTLDSLK